MIRFDNESVMRAIEEVSEEHILPFFRNLKGGDVSYKIGDDPVTIADQRAEIALSSRLLDLLPGSTVVGEENFAADSAILSRFSGESPVWIIDPIDGTRNFVGGRPEFGVIVALAEHNQTIAGWIYDPTSKEVFSAEKGGGTYHMGQKLKVLEAKKLSEMSGFLGDRVISYYEKANLTNEMQPNFKVMSASSHEYPQLLFNDRHFGKSAPQVHYRASYGYSTPWDDAAGVLMHLEAGGYSAHWNGLSYRPSNMHLGLALAPDKSSWQELRLWCETFCTFPDFVNWPPT